MGILDGNSNKANTFNYAMTKGLTMAGDGKGDVNPYNLKPLTLAEIDEKSIASDQLRNSIDRDAISIYSQENNEPKKKKSSKIEKEETVRPTSEGHP